MVRAHAGPRRHSSEKVGVFFSHWTLDVGRWTLVWVSLLYDLVIIREVSRLNDLDSDVRYRAATFQRLSSDSPMSKVQRLINNTTLPAPRPPQP